MPEPGGCTDGLRGRLSRPSVQTPCLRLPRWLPLQGTRATAILFVLGDTQAPALPATQVRVHSAAAGSLTSTYGWSASCTSTQLCAHDRGSQETAGRIAKVQHKGPP